jgi:hypothetical protein
MRLIALLAVAAALMLTSGCATPTKSGKEVARTYQQGFETDMLIMSESWNRLWLADRQYRLSRWHMR